MNIERLIRPKAAGERYQQESSVPVEATITRVAGRSAWFRIEDLHEQHEYGPAVLPPGVLSPVRGDTCLVLFTGGPNKHPWVVSWISVVPWPT